MCEKSTCNSGGVGAISLLGVVFITLKLIGVIDWSWWWVLSPFWGSAVLLLVVVILFAVWRR